eukprot:9011839-Pyramimonas_sp.AAC.1
MLEYSRKRSLQLSPKALGGWDPTPRGRALTAATCAGVARHLKIAASSSTPRMGVAVACSLESNGSISLAAGGEGRRTGCALPLAHFVGSKRLDSEKGAFQVARMGHARDLAFASPQNGQCVQWKEEELIRVWLPKGCSLRLGSTL